MTTFDEAGPPTRLTAEQVAQSAGVPTEFVTRLAEAQLIRPDGAGLHELGDVSRVQLARVFQEGGMDVDALVWATSHNILYGLDWVTDMWPAGAQTGRTYHQFADSLGEQGSLLPSVYAAFGVAEPTPETLMSRDAEEAITGFLDLWLMVDGRREVLLRAARIAGEGIRRTQIATLDLFDEAGGAPPQRIARGLPMDEATMPASRMNPMLTKLFVWLQGRHSEHQIFDRVVSGVERGLRDAGRLERPDDEPPAIAFVDLAHYTELTQLEGDQSAAEFATLLQALAEAAARRHRGRVVKLLGDGVMLRFDSAREAVNAIVELMGEMVAAGLPAGHAGIAAGPMVSKDGDVYGHTVNVAARVAAHAAAGQILLPASSAEAVAKAGHAAEDAGSVALKGLAEPLALVRVLRKDRLPADDRRLSS